MAYDDVEAELRRHPKVRECVLVLAAIIAAVAFLMTDVFWRGSTDLSVVPQPWAGLFTGLYLAECLSFGLGISFLFLGRRRLSAWDARHG